MAKFKCELCGKEFTEAGMEKHKSTVCSYNKFMCEQCDKWFGERKSLKRHVESVHNKQEIKCDKCLMVFARNDNLLKHQRSGKCSGGGGIKRKLVEEEGGQQGKVGKKVCLSGAGGSKSGGEWRCESCSLNFFI